MASGRTTPGAGQRGWGRFAVIVGLSALAHLLVLALLGMSSPEIRARLRVDEEPMTVSLLKPDLRPRPARTWTTTNPSEAPRSRVDPLQPRQLSPLAPPAEIAPLPLAPSPHRSGPVAPGSAPRQGVGFDDNGTFRKILRASPIACASQDIVGLSRLERDACDEAFGRRASAAAPMAAPMNSGKRQSLDRVAGKQQADRDWRENPTMPVGTEPGRPGFPSGLGAPTETTLQIPH